MKGKRFVYTLIMAVLSFLIITGCSYRDEDRLREEKFTRLLYVLDMDTGEELVDDVVDKIISETSGLSQNNIKMENMDNEEEVEYREERVEEYPIYDSHYEIIGYGDWEEASQSKKSFEELKEIRWISYSLLTSGLLISADSKYLGEIAISVKYGEDLNIKKVDIYR